MLMGNASSFRLFLKYEQQPSKKLVHTEIMGLSKSENSGLKICLQIPPGQSFVLVLA